MNNYNANFRPEIIIREAVPKDAEGICAICREGLGYDCTPELVEANLRKLSPDREAVFTAFAGERVAGFIHVEKYSTLYFETLANILGLAVSEEFRRLQVGTRLICAAEDWAKARGISAMRLNSGENRTGAHAFYRALGYKDGNKQNRFLKEL